MSEVRANIYQSSATKAINTSGQMWVVVRAFFDSDCSELT